MTDGIIQQVFNEWRRGILEYMNNNKKTTLDKVTDLKYEDIFSALSLNEQELIEEIRSKGFETKGITGKKYRCLLEKELIGDNKE